MTPGFWPCHLAHLHTAFARMTAGMGCRLQCYLAFAQQCLNKGTAGLHHGGHTNVLEYRTIWPNKSRPFALQDALACGVYQLPLAIDKG